MHSKEAQEKHLHSHFKTLPISCINMSLKLASFGVKDSKGKMVEFDGKRKWKESQSVIRNREQIIKSDKRKKEGKTRMKMVFDVRKVQAFQISKHLKHRKRRRKEKTHNASDWEVRDKWIGSCQAMPDGVTVKMKKKLYIQPRKSLAPAQFTSPHFFRQKWNVAK